MAGRWATYIRQAPNQIRYHRIARRCGKLRAIVAVTHSLLVSIYHMLRTHQPYQDLGSDYLEQLGFAVTLTPTSAA